MTRESLMEVLNEKSMSFSEKEIIEMIDAELDKDPDEMDSDFIDLCLDVLDGKYGEGYYEKDKGSKSSESKGKKLKLGKMLLIAAVVTTIFACSITAGAKLIKINASDDLVTYKDNHFSISLKDDSIDDILGLLSKDGIDNAVLPAAILSDDYVISNYNNFDNVSVFDFKNKNLDIYGTVNINKAESKYDFYDGQGDANSEYFSAEEVDSNGIKILIFESADYTALVYLHNDYEYTITISNCDLDSAIKIAKSIGE